jgi:hypothetical protein
MVRVDHPADKVRLWTAHSADRDFRDEKWTSRELEIQPGSSQASADVPKPAAGFTAFLAEVELTAPTGHSYKLSTQVQVTPDGVNRCRSGSVMITASAARGAGLAQIALCILRFIRAPTVDP